MVNALHTATVLGLAAFMETPPDDAKAIVLAAEGDHFSHGLDLTSVSVLTRRDNISIPGLGTTQLRHSNSESCPWLPYCMAQSVVAG